MATALTLYVTKTRTGSLAKLATSSSTTATATHQAATRDLPGVWVALGLGQATDASSTAEGAFGTGHGGVWLASTLSSKRLVAGKWTFTLRLRLSSKTWDCAVHVRVGTKNGSTFTQHGSDLVKTATLTETVQTVTITGTLPAITFTTEDRLYVEVWADRTSGNNTPSCYLSVGAAYAEIVTPGYEPQVEAGTLTGVFSGSGAGTVQQSAAGTLTGDFSGSSTAGVRESGAGALTATFAGMGGAGEKTTAAGTLTGRFGSSGTVTPIDSIATPLLSAVASREPLTDLPIVTLTVTNTEPTVETVPAAYAVVLRTDGTYVLTASPLFPLYCSATDPVSVVDRFAPYGQEVSYSAVVFYAGLTSPPSLPARATMGQAQDTERLYHRMGWPQVEDTSGELLQWLSGIGEMIQAIDSLAADQVDTQGVIAPGWSQVLDIKRCPTAVLPWLAQFLGVRLNTSARDDQQRYAIENPQGFARGTPAAILAAANQFLAPGYTAVIYERDTSPYHLHITFPLDGLAGSTDYRALWLWYQTYTGLEDGYATYADMWQLAVEITETVHNAIPGGLVAVMNYT